MKTDPERSDYIGTSDEFEGVWKFSFWKNVSSRVTKARKRVERIFANIFCFSLDCGSLFSLVPLSSPFY